jgi:hypothetical protein
VTYRPFEYDATRSTKAGRFARFGSLVSEQGQEISQGQGMGRRRVACSGRRRDGEVVKDSRVETTQVSHLDQPRPMIAATPTWILGWPATRH